MSRDIDKYTEEKLEGPFHHVCKYTKTDIGNNVTKIQYYTIPGKHLHWFGIVSLGFVNLGVGIADAIGAGTNPWVTLYFDSTTGAKLTEKDVQARQKEDIGSLIKKGDELLCAEQLQAAKLMFQRVLELDPTNKEVKKRIVIIEQVEKAGDLRAEGVKAWAQANETGSRGDYGSAMELFRQAANHFEGANKGLLKQSLKNSRLQANNNAALGKLQQFIDAIRKIQEQRQFALTQSTIGSSFVAIESETNEAGRVRHM